MSIAFDAGAAGENNPATTSHTLSHTCTGTNRFLAVSVYFINGTDDITGVTYSGVSMTQKVKRSDSTRGGIQYIYILSAPASGTNNIVVSRSSNGRIETASISLTDAGQTTSTAVDTSAGADGNDTAPTVNVTTGTANVMLLGMADTNATVSQTTAGSGFTIRASFDDADGRSHVGETQNKTSTGTYACNYSLSVSRPWCIVGLAIKEEVAVVGPVNLKTFNGLATASIKVINGLSISSVKSINGLQ